LTLSERHVKITTIFYFEEEYMKKFWLLLAILAVPTLIFATAARESGSATTGGTLNFTWWGNPTRDERTLQLVRLFEQNNPGVTVETETVGFANYWDLLATKQAAGTLPDVMQMDYAYIAQYNDRNLLVDLQPFAQRGLIDLSKWSDAGLSGGRQGGKLVGLNLGVNAWGVVVDRAVLQQAGVTINDTAWTWRDFENAALQIYQRTGVKTMPSNEHYQIIENVVRYFGVPMYSADGKSLGFTNNAAALAAVKELIDMQLRLKAAGALYDPEDAFISGRSMPEEPLSKGNTWNLWNWSNQYVALVAAAGRPLDYYLCPAPTATGMKAPFGTYLKPSMLISMLSASKNQDLAARFINFFINDVDANRILAAERGVPIPTNIMQDLSTRVAPDMKYTFDYISKATNVSSAIDPPDPGTAGQARDAMKPILLNALIGRITSDVAITQMVQAANAILSR
jgi:multiple sugar transport system substrate-binding protein